MPILLLAVSVVLPFIINLVFIPMLLRLAHWKGWYDEVDHRKIHKGNIPRLGGIGIFISFVIGLVLFYLLRYFFFSEFALPKFFSLWPFLAGMLIINGLGLIDDFRSIKAWIKVLVQLAAAAVVVVFGNRIGIIDIPTFGISLKLGPFSYVLSILWIMGLSNAVNLLDGLDGLAGGTVAIIALFISAISVLHQNYIAAAAGIILFGSLAGFLVFNLPPAKIFMGDSGSLFIGFFIAILPFIGKQIPSRTTSIFLLTLTMSAVPILDTLAAIVRRLRRRKPVLSPDKAHLHHKLLDLGYKEPAILGIIYPFTLFLGVICMLSVVYSHILLQLILPFAWLVLIGVFVIMDRIYRKHTKEQPN